MYILFTDSIIFYEYFSLCFYAETKIKFVVNVKRKAANKWFVWFRWEMVLKKSTLPGPCNYSRKGLPALVAGFQAEKIGVWNSTVSQWKERAKKLCSLEMAAKNWASEPKSHLTWCDKKGPGVWESVIYHCFIKFEVWKNHRNQKASGIGWCDFFRRCFMVSSR